MRSRNKWDEGEEDEGEGKAKKEKNVPTRWSNERADQGGKEKRENNTRTEPVHAGT